MLDTVGSFAPGAWVVFMVGMGVVPYRFGFGLKQNQRSVMALGMGTRNIAAVFVALLPFRTRPRNVLMVVLWTLARRPRATGSRPSSPGRQTRRMCSVRLERHNKSRRPGLTQTETAITAGLVMDDKTEKAK